MFPMPLRVLLKDSRGADDCRVVPGSRHELQTDRQVLFRKAARNGKRGQATKIAERAQRIGKESPVSRFNSNGVAVTGCEAVTSTSTESKSSVIFCCAISRTCNART